MSSLPALSGMLSGFLFILLLAWIATRWDLLAWLYDVRLTADSIEFILFSRWVFHRLPFTNIHQVIVGFGGWHFLTASNFRNRFSPGGTFLVLKKDGFVTRKVLISPKHPQAFAEALTRAGVSVVDFKVKVAGAPL